MSKYLLLMLLLSSQCFAQFPAAEWQHIYGGPGEERAPKMIPTTDGGFMVATTTWPANSAGQFSHCEILLMKLDESGSLEWQKPYTLQNLTFDPIVAEAPDGGFLIAGTSRFSDLEAGTNSDSNILLMRTDSSGNTQWTQTLGNERDEYARDIQLTPDGGFIVAAYRNNPEDTLNMMGYQDGWLMRFDSVGSLLWEKMYGGSSYDVIEGILPVAGGFVMAGTTMSVDGDVTSTHGLSDFWLVGLDETGNLQWEKTYGGSSTDNLSSFKKTSDGGYILTGSTYSNNGEVTNLNGQSDCWVVKTAGDGTIEWQKTYGFSRADGGFDIIPIAEGGYLLAAGTDHGLLHVSGDAWLLKLDSSGAVVWDAFGGDEGPSQNNVLLQTANGSYVIAGWQGDPQDNHGDHDVIVYKLAAGSLNKATFAGASLKLSPNPVSSVLNIELPSGIAMQKAIVSDATGKQLLMQVGGLQAIVVEGLAAGIYYLELYTSVGKQNLKFVKL